MTVTKLPLRAEVSPGDTWDLNSLFPSDTAWEKTFAEWESKIDGYAEFRGKLAQER